MTMAEPYSEDWEDRDRITPWWDPDDIVDLRSVEDDRSAEDGETRSDPGPWDLAG